jgi:hypothetical protein
VVVGGTNFSKFLRLPLVVSIKFSDFVDELSCWILRGRRVIVFLFVGEEENLIF